MARNIGFELGQIAVTLSGLANELTVGQRTHYLHLVQGIFALTVEARKAKNYELSDRLRDILKQGNVQIIQGTGEFARFEDIPKHLIGRPVADTWREIE